MPPERFHQCLHSSWTYYKFHENCSDIYQSAPRNPYIESNIFVYNMTIGVIDDVVYLRSTLSRA